VGEGVLAVDLAEGVSEESMERGQEGKEGEGKSKLDKDWVAVPCRSR
jgi:hypothetical protein